MKAGNFSHMQGGEKKINKDAHYFKFIIHLRFHKEQKLFFCPYSAAMTTEYASIYFHYHLEINLYLQNE